MLKVRAKRCGANAVLSLAGPIVIGETARLRDSVRSQTGVKTIVLDLRGVRIIDAAGFGVMLELRAATEAKGASFKLMNITTTVKQLLEITCLNTVFEITSGRELLQETCFMDSRRHVQPSWSMRSHA